MAQSTVKLIVDAQNAIVPLQRVNKQTQLLSTNTNKLKGRLDKSSRSLKDTGKSAKTAAVGFGTLTKSIAPLLKALAVPGINEVRLLNNYFGIGTIAVVAFGQGRELTKNVVSLLESRVLELELPGQNITVINGITVFLDFRIKVYIKTGLNSIEKENIISTIKRDVANLIKEKEFNNFIDLNEVSKTVKRVIPGSKIIGFGSNLNNSTIFDEIFMRKTDRFDLFPEEKIPVLKSTIFLEKEERISFGELIVELEEDIR